MLHVPKGSLEEYRIAAQWKDYVNIIDDLTDGSKGDVTGDGHVDIADVNTVINIMLGKE